MAYIFFASLALAVALTACSDDSPPPDTTDSAPNDAPSGTSDAAPGDGPSSTGDAGPTLGQVRFAIVVNNDIPESIYVQLNEEEGQVSWVVVRRDSEQVYFEERCEIEDCDMPSGVCGAALPRVRDITGGERTGSIELVWDGMTSTIDNQAGQQCERRTPAPAGAYVAEFCYALSASVNGTPDANGTASGRIENPICTEIPFDYPADTEVVHQIAGG